MPVTFKTTKIAQRAAEDPLLYEILRDMGISGTDMAAAINAAAERLLAVEGVLADGDKGDITVSESGATWTVDPGAITYAKIQDVSATSRLLGRATAGAGDVEEITLGTNLTLVGTTLNAAGGKVMRSVVYTSGSGTFTTGAGVTEIYVTASAGGGGAGGIETDTAHGGAGGGGGGEFVYRKPFTVTPSTGYAYAVGAGGTAGVNSATVGSVTSGGVGGNTTLGALMTLTGGAGGGSAVATGYGTGGAPGGPGGTRGQSGLPPTADRSGVAAFHGEGGISGPGGYGAGGGRTGNAGSDAGRGGYLLIEWNE